MIWINDINFYKIKTERNRKNVFLSVFIYVGNYKFNVSSMKTKNYYTVILRSDSDEESFEDSSLRSESNSRSLIKIY